MEADAKWTRTHAFDCKTLDGTPIDTRFAFFNNSTTYEMVVLCAVPDTDYFMKQNIRNLNVHGFNGHSSRQVAARACRSFFSTTGGTCGAITTSAVGRGDYTLRPDIYGLWISSSQADFGYFLLFLPWKKGSNISSFRGYYTDGI
jgi:hypothetical protein